MKLADLDADALAELADAGYTFRTVDEALTMAEAYLGMGREAARVFLGLPGDNVVDD